MRSTRAALIGCALGGLALVVACQGSDSGPAPRGSTSTAPPPTPERPAELLGLGALAPASSFWPALREALHPRDPSLPRSWGAALANAAGLPITAAELFEDDRPSKLALLESGSDSPELVLAVPVRAIDRLLVLAASGREARFERAHEGRLELLRPRHGSDGRVPALGVSGNHLLLSTSERALRLAGGWLVDASARCPELRTGELLRVELPPALRLGPSSARAASLFGPLGQLVVGAMPSTGEAVGSSRPTLAVTAHELGWALELSGAERELPPQAAPSGVAEALLDLPAELSAAVVVHANDAARLEQARQARSTLEALATARGLEPLTQLDALERLAEARGPLGWVGFEWSPVGPLAYGRLALRDPDAAGSALDALFGVQSPAATASARRPRGEQRSPPAGSRLRRLMRKTVLERVGEVYELSLRSDEALTPPTRLHARIESGGLLVGVGGDAAYALERVRRGDSPRLAESTWLRGALRLVPPGAHALAFVDLASTSASSETQRERVPLLVAVDGDPGGRRVRAILPPEAFAALVGAWRR